MVNQVFAGMSYADVLLGAVGRAKTAGREREVEKIWCLMSRNAGSLLLHWPKWGQLGEERQLSLKAKLCAAVAAAPPDVRAALRQAMEEEEQEAPTPEPEND
jgi:hypothetical protein